jgi:hypothetical protein
MSCSASSIMLLAILTNWPPSDSLIVVPLVVGVPLGVVVLFIVVPVLVGVSKRILKNKWRMILGLSLLVETFFNFN